MARVIILDLVDLRGRQMYGFPLSTDLHAKKKKHCLFRGFSAPWITSTIVSFLIQYGLFLNYIKFYKNILRLGNNPSLNPINLLQKISKEIYFNRKDSLTWEKEQCLPSPEISSNFTVITRIFEVQVFVKTMQSSALHLV